MPDSSLSVRNRVGGLVRAAMYDGREVTAKARRSFLDKFEDQVDPDRVLSETERQRRAEAACKAYMARLALRSAKARRRGKPAQNGGAP